MRFPPSAWPKDPALAPFVAQMRAYVENGASFRDNILSADIGPVSLVHGTESVFDNPRLFKPRAFILTEARDESGELVQLVGDPVFNPRPTNDDGSVRAGQYGLTARVAAPDGVCSIYRNAAHSIASGGSNTAIPFDTALFESGDLSFDSTNTGIACARDGYVQVNGELEYAASAAGTVRRMFVAKQGGTLGNVEIWGNSRSAPPAVVLGLSGSGLVEVSAGDVLQMAGFQDSGGNLALTVSQRRCKLDAFYVAPPIGQTVTVTGILVG
jgi:hypothetical protein